MNKKRLLNKERKKERRKRKNFLPSVIFTILLWIIVVFFIFYVDPQLPTATLFFLLFLFLALLFALSTLFANTQRGFLYSFSITAFLIMRIYGIGNLINFLLLIGVIVSIELFFSQKYP